MWVLKKYEIISIFGNLQKKGGDLIMRFSVYRVTFSKEMIRFLDRSE